MLASPIAEKQKASAVPSTNRRAPEPRAPLSQPLPLLQRSIGNRAVLSLQAQSPGRIQRKLAIGNVHDPLEHEADRVAERVLGMTDAMVALRADNTPLQPNCLACDQEGEHLRRKATSEAQNDSAIPGAVHETLATSGHPLGAETRAFFEPRFERDFSDVRVHDDSLADASARSVNAIAYTVGEHLVFRQGAFSPETSDGRRLLAHELTHVAQQNDNMGGTIHRKVDSQAVEDDPDTPWLDLTDASWTPVDDYVLHIQSDQQLYVVPSQGILFRPATGLRGPTTGAPTWWYGIPAAGKEGRGLLKTADGVGIWIEAGGATTALLPGSLAALRARMGITRITGIVLIHVHADHVRDLLAEIQRSKVPAANLVLAREWTQGTTGPLAEIVNQLRTTSDPALLGLGYGSAWQPVHASVPPIAPTGVTRLSIRIGNVEIELVGLGSAFAAYQQTHTDPAESAGAASKKADAASFLTFLRQPGAEFDIAIKTDLRGRDILNIRNEMEAARPGSFNEMFSRVGMIHGFQHHLGVINEDADIQGIQVLVQALSKGSGALRLAVQTTPEFRSDPLIRALNEAGITIITVGKPSPTEPGSFVAQKSGAATGKGAGIEEFAGSKEAWGARQRVIRLRELSEIFARNGDLIKAEGLDREVVQRQLQTEIGRLEGLIEVRLQLSLGGVARGKTATWTPDAAALAGNVTALARVEGIEARLTLADLEFARALAAEAATIRAIDKEIRARRTAGEFSPELFRLLMSIEPSHAEALRFNPKGERVSVNEWHARLSAQARTQSASVLTGPVGWGQRGVGIGLLGLQLAMEVIPLIEGWRSSNLAMNINRGLQSLAWWREKSVMPDLGAAVDPVFGEAAITRNQQNILNRISRKLWTLAPEDRRVAEKNVPTDISGAGDLDALWIERIPEAAWGSFEKWLWDNVHDYNDLATYFFELHQESVRYEMPGGGQAEFSKLVWKVRLSTFEVGGWNSLVDTWTEIPQFSTLMRSTPTRVIKTTREHIESRWANRQVPPQEGATRQAPEEIVDWYATKPLKDLRPTRRALFKSSADRELFSVYTAGPLVRGWQWQKGVRPSFLIYETAPAPEDYVVVSGGDFNTSVVIRDASLNRPEKAAEIELPKRKGIGSILGDFPTEGQLSGDQLIAWHALRNRTGRRTDKAPTSPDMWGWVEVFDMNFGGNTGGTALAVFDDLALE